MNYNYITNGILSLGLIGTSIIGVNQYKEIESNQSKIDDLNSQLVQKDRKIGKLNTISTTYEKAIVGYKERVNKLKINNEVKNKKITKLNKRVEYLKAELKSTRSKLKQQRQVSVRQPKVEYKHTKQSTKVSQDNTSKSTSGSNLTSKKTMTVTATAYTPNCAGCSGVTSTGINVKANPHMKLIAVDPSIIPLGSKVHIEGYGTAIASDTGGAIKGYKVDLLMPNNSQANSWGVRQVQLTILRYGK